MPDRARGHRHHRGPAGIRDGVEPLNSIEELRDAGAEAMQISGTVRLVSPGSFGGSPGALTVDGTPIQAPYVIRAIGSAHTLSDALGFPGGLTDSSTRSAAT